MIYMANGGGLARSCAAVFKTTPTMMEVVATPYFYPKITPVVAETPPPVIVRREIYKRLPTASIVAKSGYFNSLLILEIQPPILFFPIP
ncbi:unnamed protein product [Leptidea sinapis]|uniref:Uncharacterized protein n=1 Tax=Leptidea sinapis TaxID=189913 RepID=A0A5E4PS02_9NEOP|nr:unnamed protein product [Leptidea sinapis]